MTSRNFTIHTSVLFDPRKRAFRENISVVIDTQTGSVADIYERHGPDVEIEDEDIDLRRKVVMPGFVDAHTHIFLHSYK